MTETDENLKQLEQTFTLYCVQLRHFQRVPHNGGRHDTSPQLKELIEKLLPHVTADIDHNLPSRVYVDIVISCAVADNKVMKVMWEELFCGQATIADVAQQVDYRPQSVSRLTKLFPEKVAHQLWKKNHELANPHKTSISTKTMQQQQQEIVSQKFGLSDKETKVVLAFMRLESQSRKEIAFELGITINTLKVHRRSILKKMRVSTIREAIDKVRVALWGGESDVK
jgi:DNA-binding CsgD family transcriptional regulator